MNEMSRQPAAMRPAQIRERYTALRGERPDIRARDAAGTLGISEGELLAAQVGDVAIRLQDKPEEILAAAAPLGEVMALTRNEHCVHERKGIYENASFSTHGPMRQGLFVNPDIDLRLFMNHWKSAFAVTEDSKVGPRRSLQFFDKSGMAIHKIYLTNRSDVAAYDTLVARFRADEQSDALEIEAYAAAPAPKADTEIDWAGFRMAWENLKDTHDFFPMLRKYGVGREQAFRRIGNDFAYRVGNDAARRVLDLARDRACEIMVFVGNRGCIQIHSGPVAKLVEHGTWYNVLDPMFNLHLREDAIAGVWVTKKPTVDGHVTAVEVFDDAGEAIVTFFGKRKPGIPELELWREIVAALPAMSAADVA